MSEVISYHAHDVPSVAQYVLAAPFFIAFVLYGWGVIASNRKSTLRPWPWMRIWCWIGGVISAMLAVAGPLAAQAHADFTVHMIGHLLLGMLAPLLFVCAAPVTLLLRSLSVYQAKTVVKWLSLFPFRIVVNPVVASILNVGGLWLLYKTGLYDAMHTNVWIHIIVHLHVFLAGYAFTASMIYVDPTPNRQSFLYRSVVFVIALAGHQVLSKTLYAYPPAGVDPLQAQIGSMVMYYGGDVIDAFIIFLLCLHWYKSTRPRIVRVT